MTELLYYDDAYLQEFDAAVTDVDFAGTQAMVELDRTAFYPGGGGQPNDTGFLVVNGGRLVVNKVKRQDGKLWHWLATNGGEPSIRIGDTVHGELDWDRRYALMRTHTAMHVLCGVVWRDYGASVTGGNMEPGKGRMDFEFESMTRDLIGEIEATCNTEMAKSYDVRTQILPREEAFKIPDLIRTKINLLPKGIAEVRTVEIVGLDLQADGGTHVHNTREIGSMKVVDYKSKGKINKRIYIELGDA